MARANSATVRAWVVANPERVRATQAAWRQRNLEKVRRKARHKNWRKDGLDPEACERLLSQHNNGHCEICASRVPGGKGGWHVDHDHATGKLRGILCGSCNRGLGFFRDDTDVLEAAVRYLRFYD